MFDPVPLPSIASLDTALEGKYDTVLTDDRRRLIASGSSALADWIGRSELFRSHFWACPGQAAA